MSANGCRWLPLGMTTTKSVEWVPVESPLFEEDDDEAIEWDSRGWEDAPLFGEPSVRRTPYYPAPYTQTTPVAARREGDRRPRPKTKTQKDPGQPTKRRRKKMRAWDIEDEG